MSSAFSARRLLLALVAAGLALVGLATPASAHDRLVSSDPADGATLDVLPAVLTLEFSDAVLDTGTQVVVTTGGADVGAPAPEVDGVTVTVPLPPDLANGDYDVAWRAVSSDGHPIEGTFTFVLAVPAPEPTASPEPTEDPTLAAASDAPAIAALSDDAASDQPTATDAPADTAVTSDPSPAPETLAPGRSPIVGLIAAVAIVGTVVALMLRRRNGTRGFGPPGQD
ncbi:copper resistance protein CopC [Xylanimonas cellulosilytica DSM 15894]|uniref:Copper resistance protein CopC n=1 Tax=Xylanimonas cellulosilytica (strain DSM 15894 / JCM 12276 / CECT 5975 / KCTC 9989 / LMG 20990 / NBRC 107835 / XIL07) TaxID=446471 RepID=D1BRK4_XYLCX|nr:copper resistance CopC family protein [Xylanimonas cellulosilytica]ACZ32270.1 copper resistance protein CopC [Xylanimonas cellulosilytica DSM 15894]